MSKTTNKFSPEVRSRAVRLVLEHEHEHPSAIPQASLGVRLFRHTCGAQAFLQALEALLIARTRKPKRHRRFVAKTRNRFAWAQ
jgi:hypothetical protein